MIYTSFSSFLVRDSTKSPLGPKVKILTVWSTLITIWALGLGLILFLLQLLQQQTASTQRGPGGAGGSGPRPRPLAEAAEAAKT